VAAAGKAVPKVVVVQVEGQVTPYSNPIKEDFA